VITGDLGRHDPALKSLNVSFGNNDVTPDYYFDVEDPSEQLNMLANGFQPLI
jgi:hypothetical protein